MNWLISNLPRIATWIMIGLAIMVAITLVGLIPVAPSVLPRIFSGAEFSPRMLLVGAYAIAYPAVLALVALLVYGLVLRFLALCDDVAAIRHAVTKSAARPD